MTFSSVEDVFPEPSLTWYDLDHHRDRTNGSVRLSLLFIVLVIVLLCKIPNTFVAYYQDQDCTPRSLGGIYGIISDIYHSHMVNISCVQAVH